MSISSLFALLLCASLLPSPSVQLTNCGYCICDWPSITCDFHKVKDQLHGSKNLAEFAPNSGILRELDVDPLAYRELYINCRNSPKINNRRLTRSLLKGYANLTRVGLVNCGLIGIEPDALADLAHIRELDLSNNTLERLPAALFRHREMAVLTLSENPRLTLTAETFLNFSLERLVLSKCGLQEFPWDSLQVIRNLHELTLSQNSIQVVPSEAIQLVRRLRVFYLDENPLSCFCTNKWISESIDWNRVSPQIIKSSKLPKCGSPPTLHDVELTRLSPSDFPCQAPEIRSVDIRLEPDSAQLICSASTHQSGPLVWTYRHLAIYPELPNAYPSRTYQSSGATFRQSVHRTPGYEREKYTLTARSEDGQLTNFSLTLHWPPAVESEGAASESKTGSGGTDDSDSSSTSTGPKLPTEPQKPISGDGGVGGDYFSRKQFTLIEMIIAVVGTFMATSLVFLLACQAIQWYNKRDKKRWAAGYAGPPYSYSYNSHRPPSHEYDVPRIDQPCLLPKQPQQPPPPTQPPPPPPQHTLPMPPHNMPTGAGVSLSSTSSGSGASAAVQTLLSKHQQHHKQQQQQHLPITTSSSSNGMGETEFLDYTGHRIVFNHT
ncbi:hypothetical protein BOX15_Mlig024486g1 [Macrostomum lignano]|uniref:Ig-like domain-containing protein n=1 Tax=Macrostomum lignano TaxID=282301 RepID=A0A267G6P5_9PLAT|nr:hypothetical protein BOX15_Mlig024486g1 [Macrostomum lignano]